MTTSIYTQWDNSWSTTSIAASSITNGNASTTAAINNDTKSGTEIAISVTYGGSPTNGVNVYVLRDVNGSFEDPSNDRPFGFQMPYVASGTCKRTFSVMADRVSNFKICVVNNTGDTVTATVTYKQSVIEAV